MPSCSGGESRPGGRIDSDQQLQDFCGEEERVVVTQCLSDEVEKKIRPALSRILVGGIMSNIGLSAGAGAVIEISINYTGDPP